MSLVERRDCQANNVVAKLLKKSSDGDPPRNPSGPPLSFYRESRSSAFERARFVESCLFGGLLFAFDRHVDVN